MAPMGGGSHVRVSPTSWLGLSRVLVHFFFMSVSSRLGLSPPAHLSPGILRYLGGATQDEPRDPPCASRLL